MARMPFKRPYTVKTHFLRRLYHTLIHSVEQGESFNLCIKAIGALTCLQRVFFLVLVNTTHASIMLPVGKGLSASGKIVCLA